MNEWMNEWVNEYMNEYINEYMNEWIHEWIHGWMIIINEKRLFIILILIIKILFDEDNHLTMYM